MNPENYSPEQIKDINERVEKAKKILLELQLQPQVAMHPINIGDDVFGMKPIVYLQDMRFISPIQPKDLK